METTEIPILAFFIAQDQLEKLKAEPQPIPYGKGQYYKSYEVKKESLESLYEEEDAPYWYGYAAIMEEYSDILRATQIQEFKDKRNRK